MNFLKLLSKTISIASFVALTSSGVAHAAQIILGFDEFTHQQPITNQYQPLGVTLSGVNAYFAPSGPWPANTPDYIAYAPTGLMTYTLDSIIAGDIVAFSGYLSSGSAVEVTYFDNSNVLLGTQIFSPLNDNTFFSFVTPGEPIRRVAFLGGGADYGVDTLWFSSSNSVPEPASIVLITIGFFLLSLARRRFHP